MNLEIKYGENDFEGKVSAQIILPWLPEKPQINPLPVRFMKEEESAFLNFSETVQLWRDKGNPMFIPPPYGDDGFSNVPDVLRADASIYYRAYYYVFNGRHKVSAPANCFIVPRETTVEHLSRW
ncbi:hypothetical protein HY214_01700 [Candidatus Roizmanbacteria bacterium]|nr:hypothetical protein [Candidatus Roizmanbacteria bacterium]